jgi:uncharacterized protein
MEYNFQWNPTKAQSNLDKHGVSFRLATQVFKDPAAASFFDEVHSLEEDRWITIGIISSGQCLVVIHTFEEFENRIEVRIISVRKANKREIEQYQGEF